jgi:hypothetical protein
MSCLRQQRRRVHELNLGKLIHLCILHLDSSFLEQQKSAVVRAKLLKRLAVVRAKIVGAWGFEPQTRTVSILPTAAYNT